MNRKQIIILLVLVLALAGVGYLIRQRQTKSWSPTSTSMGKKLLGDFPINDVAHLEIKNGTNQVNLAKKDNLWRVRERDDYPANYNEISDFLIKARDLKIVQTEQVGPSQLPRLLLTADQGTNSATVIDFKDSADKSLRTLLLGKKHMRKSGRAAPQFGDMGGGDEGYPDGRYVKLASDQNVCIISEPLANIEPKPEQWLNKDFFKVEKIRAIAVTFPVETNSWKLSRETETGEWKLADAKPGEQLDAGKTSSLNSALSSPSFNDVATGTKPEQLGLDKPTLVSLETFDNFTYSFKLGQKTNDNVPLTLNIAAQLSKERVPAKDEKPEDKDKLDKEFKEKQKKLEEKLAQEKGYEKWIYLVSSWSVDPVLKERSQLMAEKKEEKKDEKPAGTETGNKTEPPAAAPEPKADSK
jgi:hypothetical protein